MKLARSSVLLGTALSVCLLSSQVEAHWCDDLWGSAYNLVVRPETDTVTVPSSGSGSLTIYVQNNMEYALPSFELSAQAEDTSIVVTRQTQAVSGKLMPGENVRYTLSISKSGGGTVNATDIDYSVSFGDGQSGWYGEGVAGKAAMIKLTDGSLHPTPPPPWNEGYLSEQATQLSLAAVTDFTNTEQGLDKLMGLYCAGRASWNTSSASVLKSKCPDATTTVCPTGTPSSDPGSKYDYMHLWSAGELAARKSALGSRAAVLRERLKCGINDDNNGFAGFAMFVLGYLGEDADARSFIEGKIAAGGDIGTIAKAALLLMGNPGDMATYKADVVAGTSASSTFVKAACAAALGIADKDDAMVKNTLFPLCQWIEPDYSDNGRAIYSAQLLNIVAWDRRGWAPNAGDTGEVSFYGGTASGGGGSLGTGGRPGTGGRQGTGGRSGTGGASGSAGVIGSGGRSSGGAGGRGGGGGSSVSGKGGSSAAGTGGRLGSGGRSVLAGGTGGSSVRPLTGGGRGGAGGNPSTMVTGGVAGASPPVLGGIAGALPPALGGIAGALPPALGGIAGALPVAGGGAGGHVLVVPGIDGAIIGTGETAEAASGCKCNVGSDRSTGAFAMLVMAGLALVVGRRRRRR